MTETAPWDTKKDGWAPFLEGTTNRPPLPFFHQALEWVGEADYQRLVIDLGCGGGAESRAFLERGWRVFATDSSPTAEKLLQNHIDTDLQEDLEISIGSFEEVELPKADLVYAQMSLPFAGSRLEAAVANALDAVNGEGSFAGHFFGNNDDWIDGVNVAAVDRTWIDEAFDAWSDVDVEEVDAEGPFGLEGNTKHWHYYFVRARR